MEKMRVILCVFSSLCCLAAVPVVFGSSDSNKNPNQASEPESECSFKCEDFRALERRNREQGKVIEELVEQMKTLSRQFDELKSEISSDHGLWLLTPPLRGPPGKDGKQGEKGPLAPWPLKSCGDAMEIFPSPRSTKQSIHPYGNSKKVEVLCDFQLDGGGWTVIQKRSSGSPADFNRTWNEYKNGFGSLDRNFWLGLENIHALTRNGDQELQIDLEDFAGNKKYAKYSNFSISDASDFYRLSIGGFSPDSTAGDSMTNPGYQHKMVNNGMRFTTKDKDNDAYSGNCAIGFGGGGGWWFNSCGYSHLNGRYRQKGESGHGISWYFRKGSWESLAKIEMKIQARK